MTPFFSYRCRERLRFSRQTPDHEGPLHPVYSHFHIRRSLKRICHYYHHPTNFHRRLEEIIDVIAIPFVMAASAYTVWEDNSPESLFILASKCILAHPRVLFRISENREDEVEMQDELNQVHEGIVLPSEICDYLLQTMVSEGLDIDDRVAKAFSDPHRSKLRRLELRNSNITNYGFSLLAAHNFRELRISNCNNLSDDILTDLNNHAENLVELSIENARTKHSSNLLPTYLPGEIFVHFS